MKDQQAASDVGVIGVGTMGAGIAHVAAAAGHRVLLHDVDAGRTATAIASLAERLNREVAKRRLGASERDELVERLIPAPRIEVLASAGLVVEAVVESLEVKRELLRRVEAVVGPDALLATNTSALSITEISTVLERPGRFLGLHFFNPPAVMPLVEVISGSATESETLLAAAATIERWGKIPVRVASTPGFIVNRIARPFYGESLRALEEGVAEAATIDAVIREAGGFRMGPLELTDLIGQDVNQAVNRGVWEGFGFDPRYAPSRLQRELVRAGRLGRKSGRGFYDYDYENSGGRPPAPAASSASRPSHVRPVGRIGALEALLAPIQHSGIAILPAAQRLGDDDGFLEIDGTTRLALTDGRLATERSSRAGLPVILIDAAKDLSSSPRVAIAAGDGCPSGSLASVIGMLQAAGKEVSVLRDVAGMLVMRTLAMIVNEAADVVGTGVATPADVDLAMRHGTGYPLGPLEWGDRIGPALLVRVLDNLADVYRDGRYRASPLLRRRALTGMSLASRSTDTKETQ